MTFPSGLRRPCTQSRWIQGSVSVGRVARFQHAARSQNWWTWEKERNGEGLEENGPSTEEGNRLRFQFDENNITNRNIHIIGVGAIGRFVAHSLREISSPPPVVLLLHSSDQMKRWNKSDKQIGLYVNDQAVYQSGFTGERVYLPWRKHGKTVSREEFFNGGPSIDPSQEHDTFPLPTPTNEDSHLDPSFQNEEPIENLIVTVKAPNTVSSLLSIRHRLTPSSTVLFLQNGMGIVEQACRSVFTDPATRPNFMLGINSHGVGTIPDSFHAKYWGAGAITLGLLPSGSTQPLHRPPPEAIAWMSASEEEKPMWAPSSRYLLRTLLRSPALVAAAVSPTEIHLAQLEKLAVNSVINPLTALLDTRNGSIPRFDALRRVTRLLLAETSAVIRRLPELKSYPNVETRFAAARLEELVMDVAEKTRLNSSSMLVDVRRGMRTEIEYINGYVVKRGEELGIKCFMNYFVIQLVKGRRGVVEKERMDKIPLV